MARQGGVLLLVGVGLLLGGGKKWGGRRKGGRRPPSPSPIRTPHGRGRATSWLLPSLSPQGPLRPNTSPGGSGNPPTLRFFPKSPGTLPVSEYSRPIYQSLYLEHFETPCHVRDHIRDSEQPLVHQNAKTHNRTVIITLSVRTLRVREQCRHDRDTSPVNNQ